MTRRRRKRSEIINFNGIYNLNGMLLAIYSKNIYILLGDSILGYNILEYKLNTKNIIPKVIDTNSKNIILPVDIESNNIAILQEYIKSKNNNSENIAVSKEKEKKEKIEIMSRRKEKKENDEEPICDLGLFKNPFEIEKIEIEQSPKTFRIKKITEQIITYLNKKAEKKFNPNNKKSQRLIEALLKEGYTIEDFKFVIDSKYDEWFKSPKYSKYLRPMTLFNYNHFENYVNEKPSWYRTEEEELKAIERMMEESD